MQTRQFYILLAIMTAAIGFIVLQYVSPNQRAEEAALQVEEIARQIRQNHAQRIDYWGLNTQSVIDNNMLTNLSYDDGKLINALGKPVKIGSGENGDTVMPGERSFDVVYSGLSAGECVYLAAYHFEKPEELGLLKVTVISKDKRQSFTWGEEEFKLPVSRPEAKKICRNGSNVLWTIE